jgi:putative hydrolase of the HAD superfamily
MICEGNQIHTRIRAIIFDMDNTLFDFVAAKQHACREVAGFLGRDDWEKLFSCFLESPHGFESHENIKDYFDLCGLLDQCSTRLIPVTESEGQSNHPGGTSPHAKDGGTPPDADGNSRINSSLGTPHPAQISPMGASPHDVHGKGPGIHLPGGSSITREGSSTRPSGRDGRRAVRDNLLADRSLYASEVFSRCCAIYEAEKVRVLTPYPGARETLGELKRRGIPLAIVTDAINGNALARLRRTGLSEFFDHVISYDMTGAKKPAPDAFLLALEKLGTRPPETLLVGDSLRRDIAPARALGMITAYARYGDRNVRGRDPPDCHPDYVLDDIRDLMELI